MALTLNELFENMQHTRDITTDGSPLKDVFGKALASFDKVSASVKSMSDAITNQYAKNQVSMLVGAASDVQKQIQELLKAKIAEDQIERERHQRMMDISEKTIPQVTEEQLKALKMQQLAYREHQKTLANELEIEKKKAEVHKQAAQEIADRQIKLAESTRNEKLFALKDKYGTMQSAITGASNMAQDPFTKFLVSGLGRFVKKKKETPQETEINKEFEEKKTRLQGIANSRKNLEDKILSTKNASIEEDFAIRAAKQHIADPGSASKLYAERDALVKKYAEQGVSLEKNIQNGSFDAPTKETTPTKETPTKTGGAVAITGESIPLLSSVSTSLLSIDKHIIDVASTILTVAEVLNRSGRTNVAEVNKYSHKDIPEITRENIKKSIDLDVPTQEKEEYPPRKAPKNAKFEKASRQSSPLLTPVKQRTKVATAAPITPVAQATNTPRIASSATKGTTQLTGVRTMAATTGTLGSKAGFLNLGALTSIAGSLGSIASSALKFLGPWGAAASAFMSFNRLVPIGSDLVGAILDLGKLVIPFGFSMLVESLNGILAVANTIVQYLDQKWFGAGKLDKWSGNIAQARDEEALRQLELEKTRQQVKSSGGAINTTSIEKNNGFAVGKATLQRQETILTNPREEVSMQPSTTTTRNDAESRRLSKEQNERDQQMREAVMTAAKTPGTTPVYVKSPYLEPWYA